MIDIRISNDIVFDSKADAVPFNYRISYKVSLICLIIGKCCGKKGCSETKIQLINSAVYNPFAQSELLNAVENNRDDSTLIRYDPSISRAINISIYDELIYQQGNGLFRLTDTGKQMSNNIDADKDLMIIEKQFFQLLSNKLTEEFIQSISKNWR